jgi:hypothetical protein
VASAFRFGKTFERDFFRMVARLRATHPFPPAAGKANRNEWATRDFWIRMVAAGWWKEGSV